MSRNERATLWRRGLRVLRVSVGFVWAASLVLAAVWMWSAQTALAQAAHEQRPAWEPRQVQQVIRFLALGLGAAGQFLFAFLIADEVCPHAPGPLRGFIKSLTGLLAVGALLLAAVLAWRLGR